MLKNVKKNVTQYSKNSQLKDSFCFYWNVCIDGLWFDGFRGEFLPLLPPLSDIKQKILQPFTTYTAYFTTFNNFHHWQLDGDGSWSIQLLGIKRMWSYSTDIWLAHYFNRKCCSIASQSSKAIRMCSLKLNCRP